jgi:two-component system sensor histidine kinase KdpD
LTTIKAFAEELAGTGDERALAIVEEAERLNRLVADLLEISRLKSGKVPPRIELHPVDDLVGGVLQRVAGALGGREVKVELPESSTVLVGRFDLGEATRILVNLIDNANKYSPPGPPVELTVTAQGERLVFEVLDRGPGVAEAERDRIFEPFYQAPDRPPDLRGTGLGLAIARQLAQRQGGTLTYAPRSGGGSRFSLTLPAARLFPGESL